MGSRCIISAIRAGPINGSINNGSTLVSPAVPAVLADNAEVVSFPRQPAELAGLDLTGIDAAVATLEAQPRDIALASAKVLHKLLSNLKNGHGGNNVDRAKFSRVRLSNSTIRAKVVAVPGAVDLLVAAGFVRVPDDNDNRNACQEHSILQFFGMETSPD